MFKEGDIFVTKNGYKGKVLRLAAMNEFGFDFYYEEINYVVEFEFNTQPIATYNIVFNNEYTYIMNIKEMYPA